MDLPRNAKAVACALSGTVVGNSVLAPGPGHSPSDRSLSIKLEPSAPAALQGRSGTALYLIAKQRENANDRQAAV